MADPQFYRYYFNSPDGRALIRSSATGSVQQNLNITSLHRLHIPVPPLETQRGIARLLGALDDKVELNRRMNETLEQTMEVIFRHVRRAQPQRDVALGDCIELAYGKALKHSVRQPGSIPVYGSNGRVGWHDKALVPGPGIVVGRKGNPGVVTWVDDDFFPIDTTFYVVPKREGRQLPFIYYALRVADLPGFAADSAVPGLNRAIAYGVGITFPDDEVIERFGRQVEPLIVRSAANNRESRTLAALRDALLPKLISGELRIKDTERLVEII